MLISTDQLLERPAPAGELLEEVRDQREARDAAEVRILQLAVAWADRHTIDPARPYPGPGSEDTYLGRSVVLPDDADTTTPDRAEEAISWLGLPTLAWDTAASFAAALGRSTGAGKALIRDALTMVHRLPRVWARVEAGQVEAWRARRIAQSVLGEPDDVATYVDQEAAPVAGEIGPVLLDRILDEAKLRLHAEDRELDQLERLDHCHVTLHPETLNHVGIAELSVRGDWADLAAFDDAVSDIASALARAGSDDSLDARRAAAVGVLADPEQALALLRDDSSDVMPKRSIELVVHLTEHHLRGADPVCTDDSTRPWLSEQIRSWAHRADRHLTVRPVRHCGGCPDCNRHTVSDHLDRGSFDRYRPTTADREIIALRTPRCVFPHCTRSARTCDADHRDPWNSEEPELGGPTCWCNLDPLCRHHHRLKTHAGWRSISPAPGTHQWTDRYGQRFLVDRIGTRTLDP